MNEMRNTVAQRVVERNHREYLLVDQPTMENLNDIAINEIQLLVRLYGLTDREARIIWLLRSHIPVDLSLITAARTHIHTIRKKLIQHNLVIKSLWRGVYELSIVGD